MSDSEASRRKQSLGPFANPQKSFHFTQYLNTSEIVYA